MTDKKEKTIEVTEKGKQSDPQLLEREEELTELDLEGVAGACGVRFPSCLYSKSE